MPPKTVVPKDFPKSKALKKIVEKGESLNSAGTAMLQIKNNWKAIVYDICSGLSAADLAAKYGFSRRSLFRFLAKINLGFDDILKACKEEEEFERMTRLEKLQKKMERLKIVPTSREEFAQLDIIKRIVDDLRREGVTEKVINTYLRTWHELCLYVGKHPSDLTVEDLRKFYDYKMEQVKNQGYDLRSYDAQLKLSTEVKTPLRVLCKALGLPIEPWLRTVEYQGKYSTVRIDVRHRYLILKYAKEMFPEDYELIRAVLFYLYRTGSRRSALIKVEFEVNEEIGVVFARTREKGKRYQIEWVKVIPKDEYDKYIKGYVPLSSDEKVYELTRKLKKVYERALADIKETLTYKYAMKKPLHIWRHTACLDLLEASDWNIALVAKTLGWRNPKMITNVYGEMPLEYVLSALGFIKREKVEWKFLYGEWEKKAREEGLI